MIKKLSLLLIISGAVFIAGGCSFLSPQPEQTTQPAQTIQPQTQGAQTTQIVQTPKPQITEARVLPVIQTHQPADGKKIAYITIDDGPSSNNTVKNLATLKKYGIKATFFVLPRNADAVYKQISDEGHLIANHSYSHDVQTLYKDIKFFEEDLLKARKMIEDKLGLTTTVYRFPGGTMGRNKTVIAERVKILEKYGYKYYDWDVSTGDTDTGPAGKVKLALVNNVILKTKDRNKLIILMHDDPTKVTTTEALPDIIEGLIKLGYTFDVLSNY